MVNLLGTSDTPRDSYRIDELPKKGENHTIPRSGNERRAKAPRSRAGLLLFWRGSVTLRNPSGLTTFSLESRDQIHSLLNLITSDTGPEIIKLAEREGFEPSMSYNPILP